MQCKKTNKLKTANNCWVTQCRTNYFRTAISFVAAKDQGLANSFSNVNIQKKQLQPVCVQMVTFLWIIREVYKKTFTYIFWFSYKCMCRKFYKFCAKQEDALHWEIIVKMIVQTMFNMIKKRPKLKQFTRLTMFSLSRKIIISY